jgi:hypothetical protein
VGALQGGHRLTEAALHPGQLGGGAHRRGDPLRLAGLLGKGNCLGDRLGGSRVAPSHLQAS